MPDYIIKRLQRLLNAAARIITNLGKYDHITDAMKKLHWLPIESRIQYKVLALVHACVHNIAPPYLSSLLTSYVPSREMRSSGKLILHQPIPNMVTYGKRSFAYGGPRLWNNLDIKLRTIVSPETFKRELKTHLYKSVYTCLICSLSISILFLMSLVEGIMCHSIHYFTIVFNILLLQYVQLVSNVSLSCILYMLLPFDIGIIYLLDVNKCTHLVSGGIHSTLLEILLWSATEQVTGN